METATFPKLPKTYLKIAHCGEQKPADLLAENKLRCQSEKTSENIGTICTEWGMHTAYFTTLDCSPCAFAP